MPAAIGSGARRAAGALALGACLALASSCAPDREVVARAVVAVDRAFQKEYERILSRQGTRRIAAPRGQTFVALLAALRGIGMSVPLQDPSIGALTAVGPAPLPLDAGEWPSAAEADLPLMRRIACPIVGELSCQFVKFEPAGLEVDINATLIDVDGGTEVSLTARMREIAPPPDGMPRRSYLPPTAVEMGLDKIWKRLDATLAAGRAGGARR